MPVERPTLPGAIPVAFSDVDPTDRRTGRYTGRHFVARRRRRLPVVIGAVVALGLLVTAGAYELPRAQRVPASSGGAGDPPAKPGAPGAGPGRAAGGSGQVTPPPGQALSSTGLDGPQSAAILAENRLPGTTAWQITDQPPTGFIEGFADTTYAAAGENVGLYVSTSAASFQVVAYRMGWYGGDGARRIWSSPVTTGVEQPACPVDHETNMVSCDNWGESLTMPVTSAFVQGDYLLELVGSDGEQSYVPLTIWDPSSTAAYLVMARSLTEQGWNTFGGYSYYQGKGPCILGQTGSYPVCNRARVVSFDRPLDSGNGASDFLSNEYPLVELMEEEGLDVAYCTDVTVDEHPDIVSSHKALLSLGHDETWTYPELQAARAGLSKGVNLLFFGSAAIVRHARLQASPLGPDREEVDYRNSAEDPLSRDGSADRDEVTGNTWSAPPTDVNVVPLVGEMYSGYLNGQDSVPFVVSDASSWLYQGTGLQDGSTIPGVISSDFDHLDPQGGSPGNIEVLGHSPIPAKESFSSDGYWDGDTYSDMTYYTDPASGAGVLDTGTVNWIGSIQPCVTTVDFCPRPEVRTITTNALRLFGSGPAGLKDPSVANWRDVRPTGS